jgi:hypothetical protein
MFKLCLAVRKAIKCGEITIPGIGECSAVIPPFLFKRACQVPLRELYPARGKSDNTACCNSPTFSTPSRLSSPTLWFLPARHVQVGEVGGDESGN